MYIKTILIPIYFGYFRIVIAKDFHKALTRIKCRDKFPEHNVNGYDGFAFPDKKKNGVNRYTVFIKPNATPSVIAHEIVHVVNALYIDSGIQLDRHNDEHQAYLTGWFTAEIYKALKKKK